MEAVTCIVCHDECLCDPVLPCRRCSVVMCADCADEWLAQKDAACPQCRIPCDVGVTLTFLDKYATKGHELDLSAAEVLRSALAKRDVAVLPHGVPGVCCGREEVLFVRGGRAIPTKVCSLMCNAASAVCGESGYLIVSMTLTGLHADAGLGVDTATCSVHASVGASVKGVGGMNKALARHLNTLGDKNAKAGEQMSPGDFIAQCNDWALAPQSAPGRSGELELQREVQKGKTERYRARLASAEKVLTRIMGFSSNDINRCRWLFDVHD